MELLAGRDDTNVTVKENGCTYQFDFAKVYWNSRLGKCRTLLVMPVASQLAKVH